jgi:hypothetical protein
MATTKTTPVADAAQAALARIASGKSTVNRERLRRVPDTTPAPWLAALKKAAGGEAEFKKLMAARPKELSPVAFVWETCDEMPEATRSEIIAECVAGGVNKSTAATQHGLWKAMTSGASWAYEAERKQRERNGTTKKPAAKKTPAKKKSTAKKGAAKKGAAK